MTGLEVRTARASHAAVAWQSAGVRVVVFGAGAIGGLVGARLFQHGDDVTLVARGAHAEALASGLVLEAPDESLTLPIPVVTNVSALRWTDDTVVLLAVKGQDTEEALNHLVTVAPQETPIVCMQNGVENERRVLRRFPLQYRPTPSGTRAGGSSWQSLERGTGSIESEFLNGEIALLGALVGLDAPVNRRLTVLALQAVAGGRRAGSWGIEELSAAVGVPADC
jgi:ketopantoate reductase